MTFRNGFEVEIGRVEDYQLFEKGFRNDRTVAGRWAGTDATGGRFATFAARRAVNFDSDLTLYGASADWALGDSWRLGYSLTRLELDPDPEGDTTWIHVFETLYAFNPDLFVKLFVQSNSAIDKVNVQAVGVWRFKPPFGSFQLAYQRGTSEAGQISTQGDTVFTKLSWVFSVPSCPRTTPPARTGTSRTCTGSEAGTSSGSCGGRGWRRWPRRPPA